METVEQLKEQHLNQRVTTNEHDIARLHEYASNHAGDIHDLKVGYKQVEDHLIIQDRRIEGVQETVSSIKQDTSNHLTDVAADIKWLKWLLGGLTTALIGGVVKIFFS